MNFSAVQENVHVHPYIAPVMSIYSLVRPDQRWIRGEGNMVFSAPERIHLNLNLIVQHNEFVLSQGNLPRIKIEQRRDGTPSLCLPFFKLLRALMALDRGGMSKFPGKMKVHKKKSLAL